MSKLTAKGRCFYTELKNSKTEQNLMTAFSGESLARNKYTFFAAKARADGFEQIANLFLETADDERAHAEIWFNYLGAAGKTDDNLTSAAAGEHYEWAEMYDAFAKAAREEGFDDIAVKFELVGKIESEHEKRFNKLLKNVKDNEVFRSGTAAMWVCGNCGHIHIGEAAPENCPVCGKPRAYFAIKAENY